jgi:serine/threonine protein kinase
MADPLTPDDPRHLGEFELVGRLGEGGQGVVYLANDPSGKPVAVKVLLRADAASRARLSRELAAMESVAPFCTARVLAVSLEGARPYVVSEFVAGPSLAAHVRGRGPLAGGELERLVVGTATALAAIHAAGVVHRDFKPANVLLGPDGPRVVDFGIARAEDATTMTSGLVGTPAYLAPELVAGRPAAPASDVFAWAATMVFAATGRSPFAADGIPAVLNRIVNHQPDLSELPQALRDLIAAGLEKDPARRPTAHELLTHLLRPASTPSSPSPPGSRPEAARHAGSPDADGSALAYQPSVEELAALGSRIAAGSTMPPSAPPSAPPSQDTTNSGGQRRPGGGTPLSGRLIGVALATVAMAFGAIAWLDPFGSGRTTASSPPGSGGPGTSGLRATTPPATAPPTTGTTTAPARPDQKIPTTGTTLATDSFARTVEDGLGRADVGGDWWVEYSGGGISVREGTGQVGLPTPRTGYGAYLKDVSSTRTDLTFTFASDKPATGRGMFVYAVGRKIPGSGTYRATIVLRPDGGVALQLSRSERGGTETWIGAYRLIPGLTTDAALRVRLQVIGTTPTRLRAKVWAAGGTEPDWQVSADDATPTLQHAGTAGLGAFLSRTVTNAPVTISVDDLKLVQVAEQ